MCITSRSFSLSFLLLLSSLSFEDSGSIDGDCEGDRAVSRATRNAASSEVRLTSKRGFEREDAGPEGCAKAAWLSRRMRAVGREEERGGGGLFREEDFRKSNMALAVQSRTPYMDVICIQSGGRVDFANSIVQYMISALVPGMISAFMPGDQTSLHVPLVRAI